MKKFSKNMKLINGLLVKNKQQGARIFHKIFLHRIRNQKQKSFTVLRNIEFIKFETQKDATELPN